MPGRGTPHRAFRVPDELWHEAKRVAEERGETMTAVIRRALEQYVARHEKRKARRPER